MVAYRVPTADGELLAVPPLAQVGQMVHANRASLARSSLAAWREQARVEVLAAARDYLHAVGQPLPPGLPESADSLIVSGHQPELFHPGVWIKNFVLNRLARTCGAIPLYLVVDNDTVKSAAMRVPVLGDGSDPRQVVLRTERFDQWMGETPYETHSVADESLFASLPERLAPVVSQWPFVPMLQEVWPQMAALRGRQPLLGERFAYGRRAVERAWGCVNWELPISRLCRTHAFARFAARLLADAPRLVHVYNTAVREYRRLAGIRSRNHPVPDLIVEGDWYEVPFWGQRQGQSQRGRLMVCVEVDKLRLRVGQEAWPTLPLRGLSEALHAMQQADYAIRTRALTTTLFARLVLADCFIHGIGGAKYDELTDELCRQYMSIEPPGYAVVTATLRLPLPQFPANPVDRACWQRRQRELYWNPQKLLVDSADPAVRALVERKLALIIQRPSTRRGRRARYAELASLTAQLRPTVASMLQGCTDQLSQIEGQLHANAILSRRDYCCWLYPSTLVSTLAGIDERTTHLNPAK